MDPNNKEQMTQEQIIQQLENKLKQQNQELKSLRDELSESEKLVWIGQLSAGILHEIKNPLNFVNNFSKLSLELIKELNETIANPGIQITKESRADIQELSETLKNNLTKILESGERAQRIIFSMLAQTRKETSTEFTLTDINQLVDEFTKLAYQGLRGNDPTFNVAIHTNYDPNAGSIKVVASELSRVIINIVNNGCYALNEKKKTQHDDFSPVITVSTEKLKSGIEIRIKDNGPGIPQAVIDKIFNPFFTTKPVGQGTGLGLSLCYDIITKTHKGTIEAVSDPGNYTEFIINIPSDLN